MSKKYMFINLSAQIVAFAVSFIISFFITPRIIGVVGKETYGFLGLANNFTGYVSVLTVALNALAGRFVTISIHQNKEKEANEYFNSVMVSNILISAVLIIPSVIFILNLENILNLPPNNIFDIKLTFTFVFLSFFLNLICSLFSVATFARNKIYLSSIRTIESNILRIIIIVATFSLFTPRISFVSGALLAANIFVALTNYVYTKKLLPEIHLSRKYFCFAKVKELIISGCWNSITSLSNMLLEGLDLLISNIFISPAAMGIVAIVKTIPNMLNQCMGAILNVFLPQLTIDYAKEKRENMIEYINYTCKLIGLILALPLAFVIVFGDSFYALWVPAENAPLLWGLSVLSLSGLLFAGSVNIMYNLYNVTNKLKMPAIATLVTGVLNTVIVLALLKFTSLGIVAVVAVSSILGILRNLFFNVPYSAKCINIRTATFYKIVLRSVVMVAISCCVGLVIKIFANTDTWISLIFWSAVMCVIAFFANFVIFYSKEEKRQLTATISAKIRRKNKNDK